MANMFIDPLHYLQYTCTCSLKTNISRERLKCGPVLRQMRESTLPQTKHLCVACETQKIPSSDLPKRGCALITLPNFPPFVGPSTQFQKDQQTGCRYVNFFLSPVYSPGIQQAMRSSM